MRNDIRIQVPLGFLGSGATDQGRRKPVMFPIRSVFSYGKGEEVARGEVQALCLARKALSSAEFRGCTTQVALVKDPRGYLATDLLQVRKQPSAS
jgi:hypothetical protein